MLKRRHLQPASYSFGRSKAARSSCKPSSASAHLSFVSLPHKTQVKGTHSAQSPIFCGQTASDQSFFTYSRLSVTLAVRLLCFRSECAVTHLRRQAARILSRRHELRERLGGVAAAGAGFVRATCSFGAGNGRFDHPYSGDALRLMARATWWCLIVKIIIAFKCFDSSMRHTCAPSAAKEQRKSRERAVLSSLGRSV